MHEGLSQRDEDYDLCGMISSTASIPDEGYFGITAATGGLSDDHDVISFIVHSLTPLDEVKVQQMFQLIVLHISAVYLTLILII